MRRVKVLVVCLVLALFTSGCATSTLFGIWLGTSVLSDWLEEAHEDEQDERLEKLEQVDEAAEPNEVNGVANGTEF